MPKTLWNYDHMTLILNGVATQPGESREFSDEEIEQGFTGAWSEGDPRRGLPEEKAWKSWRDEIPVPDDVPDVPKALDFPVFLEESPENPETIPAESGNQEEA